MRCLRMRIAQCLIVLLVVGAESASQRNLKTICSGEGWMQNSLFCTAIVSRVKAAFCRVMFIRACAPDNAIQTSDWTPEKDIGETAQPYWILDDVQGTNITVFFNLTGFSAPNTTTPVLQDHNLNSSISIATSNSENEIGAAPAVQIPDAVTHEIAQQIVEKLRSKLKNMFEKKSNLSPVNPD